MDAMHIAGAVMAGVLQTVGVRSTTEQPHYAVVERAGPVEIRRYDSRIVAEAVVDAPEERARNEGFRLVAGYIFGANAAAAAAEIAMTAPVAQAPRSSDAPQGRQIAMTAPVAQKPSPAGWRIQFFMPAKYSLKTLPRPRDPRVSLVELPPQTYAVIAFSGSRAPKVVGARQAQMLQALQQTPWAPAGEPQSWFYDPPWTPPFFRRNEVAVPVERR